MNLKLQYFEIYVAFLIFKSRTVKLLVHTKALGRTEYLSFTDFRLFHLYEACFAYKALSSISQRPKII